MEEYTPIHFFDEKIAIIFDAPPKLEKAPTCPNGFTWNDQTYRILRSISEWVDFSRSGKMANNMRPTHAMTAASRGSLNVGRYYFRVEVNTKQIFDIYYDRAMKNLDDRKGQWIIYRELEPSSKTDGG
ncbi:MAG: hypothetical protein H6635_17180 [Anaerolineales bacterium]|nr:hypothetical protein [Anaerolineales bacterium]